MRYQNLVLKYAFIILLLFLPVQTLVVQVLVVFLDFPVIVAAWKEVLVLVISFILVFDIYQILQKKSQKSLLKSDFLVLIPIISGISMLLLALLNSVGKSNLNFLVLGLRYQVVWVLFFGLLVAWVGLNRDVGDSDIFKSFLISLPAQFKALFFGFFGVFLFSIFSFIFGSVRIYDLLAGDKTLQSLNLLKAHTLDAVSGDFYRLNATFNSPNQLALYCLIILPVFIHFGCSKDSYLQAFFKKGIWLNIWFWRFGLVANLLILCLTFARFSYISLFFLGSFWLLQFLFQKFGSILVLILKRFLLTLCLVLPIVVSVLITVVPNSSIANIELPTFLSKPASTDWHIAHTRAAWRALTNQRHPELKQTSAPEKTTPTWNILLTGYGLGSTVPAADKLPLEQNPIVLHGVGLDDGLFFPRYVSMPLALTAENWFLSLWLQGGLFYLLFFLVFCVYFCLPISSFFKKNITKNNKHLRLNMALVLTGIFVAALILDLFDSQATMFALGLIWSLSEMIEFYV
jgi:hypothetical protein